MLLFMLLLDLLEATFIAFAACYRAYKSFSRKIRIKMGSRVLNISVNKAEIRAGEQLKVRVQLALSNNLRVRQGKVELIRVENTVRQTSPRTKHKKIRRKNVVEEIFIQNEDIYGMRSIDVTLSIPSDVAPTMRGAPVAGRRTDITWEIAATLKIRSFTMTRLITHGIVILPPFSPSTGISTAPCRKH